MSTDTATLPTHEGEIDFAIPSLGKVCKTYYKVIGDLKSGKRPLVALHGGPGVSSEYLEILSDITQKHGNPIVLYDQIGTGRSTHLPETMGDTKFWTDQHFLDELDNVLKKLGIQDDYDVLGHSWGGMLGSRHAVRQAAGLKHLVLMSTPADMQLWVKSQLELLTRLPTDIQDTLRKHEQDGTTDSEEYKKAMGYFYSRFLCTLNPIPPAILAGFAWIEKDPTVYLTMNGPSEFYITGPLRDWTVIPDAHKISVPTLLTNGKMDEATDSVVLPFFKEIPKVRWVNFSESSHMAHYEERERFMEIVGDFLSQ
ncbi:proline-specific peptidase [Gymnopilus junonius]|uniref:Proline-specific peptidase n=1 Tax=Gymnopilus junonius TaxID=109634 RepID=A0A9P5TNQ6_GYMJU|nr:proline-specific peptidase [Gymnopilus junonius]